jgi:phosphatidylserine/phosphatidylglycerophosphate/cardiolipin synthase-like enzyme
VTSKASARKGTNKKAASKKAAHKKPTTKKAASKKAASKKAAHKRPAGKAPARKAPARKAPVKKPPTRKGSGRKGSDKKSPPATPSTPSTPSIPSTPSTPSTPPPTTAPRPLNTKNAQSGLTVKAYAGAGATLLAFDLDSAHTSGFAGFAIKRTAPDGQSAFLPNRLNFTINATADTRAEALGGFPSDEAPFQTFRWIDVPEDLQPGDYEYEVTAMYFADGGQLRADQSVTVTLQLEPQKVGAFDFGFTRGYLSSQAYAVKFKNALISPAKRTVDYPTAQFEAQYEWLGAHSRKLVFQFVNECVSDTTTSLDLFAFDLDEPDFLRDMQKLGPRLRAFLDNASLHTKPNALEIPAHTMLVKSAGAANVKQGHFQRFAHNKVLIMKRGGQAVKVLTGSGNFSVRGLYVQANNTLVFDDPTTAGLYEEAFEQAFNDAAGFKASAIAEGWTDVATPGLPRLSVCFSPHKDATVSLNKVSQAITGATSSVLFAVMELAGGGPVMDELKALPSRPKMFSYGMTQTSAGIKVYKPGEADGIIVPFAYLKDKVPPPFQDEYSGGAGIVIHDKFVVVDFNGANPVVFTGSSNLAAGGEEQNGDNLLAIHDPAVANAYGVEAIRLVDHYHFRANMQSATSDQPLVLQQAGAQTPWWTPYYDPANILSQERVLFSN